MKENFKTKETQGNVISQKKQTMFLLSLKSTIKQKYFWFIDSKTTQYRSIQINIILENIKKVHWNSLYC
jgi:hypothetical protein